MSDFKTILTEEQMQLNERINKLQEFILSDPFKHIAEIQQSLLKVQLKAMQTYSQCLTERASKL
jgi:Txe/YoeB family toxin of Txe-Axe toxin-antitoxin module